MIGDISHASRLWSVDPAVGDDLFYHTAETIVAHPRFARARRAYVEAMLRLYEHDLFKSRLLIEATRTVVFHNILCLHFAQDRADRTTWPTIQRLQETVAPYRLSSARRVQVIVAHFVHTGYLRSSPAATDRRVRILTPADRMLAHDRDRLAAHYTPLEVLFPESGYALPLRRDPSFQRVLRTIGRRMPGYAARAMSRNPAVMLFMRRDAGAMILTKLVQLADGDHETASRISFADLGARFGVSRTHVRNTLRDIEKEGLVQLSDGGIRLMPPLLAAFDRFVADTMAGSDLMFRMAMEQLEAMPTESQICRLSDRTCSVAGAA